jgi:hypothetical protein
MSGELIVFAVVAVACVAAAVYLTVKGHPWMAFAVLLCIPSYRTATKPSECPAASPLAPEEQADG